MSEVATQSAQQAEVEPSVVINADPNAGGDDTVTSTAPDSVEAEARAAGWVPKEEWKNAPERWTDAATFLDKRNHVLPLVRKENQSLRDKLAAAEARLARIEEKEREQEAARESLTIETLKIERRQALENQDYERLAAIDDKLLQAGVKAEVAKTQPKAPEQQRIDPQVQEIWNRFEAANEWVKSDEARQVLMEQMVTMKAAGSRLVGEDMLNGAKDRVKRLYPEWFPKPRAGMAESGGYNGAPRSGTRTWNDLKPEVREALDRFIENTPGTTRASVLKNCAEDPETYFKR